MVSCVNVIDDYALVLEDEAAEIDKKDVADLLKSTKNYINVTVNIYVADIADFLQVPYAGSAQYKVEHRKAAKDEISYEDMANEIISMIEKG